MAGSGNAALATAARRLLDERIAAVQALGAALREYEAANAAYERGGQLRDEKAAVCRVELANARTAGWTPSELHELGLEVPAAARRRRESPAQEAGATTDSVEAAGTTDGDGSGVSGVSGAASTSSELVDDAAAAGQRSGTTGQSDGEERQR